MLAAWRTALQIVGIGEVERFLGDAQEYAQRWDFGLVNLADNNKISLQPGAHRKNISLSLGVDHPDLSIFSVGIGALDIPSQSRLEQFLHMVKEGKTLLQDSYCRWFQQLQLITNNPK